MFDYATHDYEASKFLKVTSSQSTCIPCFDIWCFPDTSTFSSPLNDTAGTCNSSMESYFLSVLLCFYQYHPGDTLMINDSHMQFLRAHWLGSPHDSVVNQ